MYERNQVVSRELRFWREQRMTRHQRYACVAMTIILIVGLCALWSVQ